MEGIVRQVEQENEERTGIIDCPCQNRKVSLDPPDKLLFPAVPENRARLEQWIKDYYSGSAFNICKCQPFAGHAW